MVGLVRRMMGRHEDASPTGLRIRGWLMRNMPGQLTCIEFEQFIHDYQEGSLTPRERRAFDLHMELCPMCRVYLAYYVQTVELGKRICAADDAATAADLPQELVDAVLEARGAANRR